MLKEEKESKQMDERGNTREGWANDMQGYK